VDSVGSGALRWCGNDEEQQTTIKNEHTLLVFNGGDDWVMMDNQSPLKTTYTF
jgi:hypothetical protein